MELYKWHGHGDAFCRGFKVSTAVQNYYDWIISVAPEVALQYKEVCDNGVDDDGDGRADANDLECIYCGNGIVNVGEACDKSEFSGNSNACSAWSELYGSGNVTCNDDCTINYDPCELKEYCGDGLISGTELCDGSLFSDNITKCADYSSVYTDGELKCNSSCRLDYSGCVAATVCGDGSVNGSEACDGTKFLNNRYACNSLFPELYESGRVKCTDACTYDVSDCVPWCGNGSLNKKVGEVCDDDKFDHKTCADLVGPGSTGTLKYVNNCKVIDTSGCSKPHACGNNIVESDEECDGSAFLGGKHACSEISSEYGSGQVYCNSNCTLNYSQCKAASLCGNGVVDEGEQCDGKKFLNNRYACNTLFPDLYESGQVTCNNDCTYNLNACNSWCGNGSVNSSKVGEVCDHSETKDTFTSSLNTCEKVVGKGSAGTLICADDCKSIITVGCTEPAWCGDGVVNNAESCDGDAFIDTKTLCADWDSKYASGSVSCTTKCGIDFSQCILKPVCGDHIVAGEEECDGLAIKENKTMCSDWDANYVSGRVTCNQDCLVDTTNCKTEIVKPDEICDNKIDDSGDGLSDCDDPTCATEAVCQVCGNGKVDGDEECDGSNFRNNLVHCSDWMSVFKSGTVSCNSSCKINYDACSTLLAEICDNKVDDNGNGRIDCDDVECIDVAACIGETDDNASDNSDNSDNSGDSNNQDTENNPNDGTSEKDETDNKNDNETGNKDDADNGSSSACAASPFRSSSMPISALFMGILLAVGLCMRRKTHA